MGIPRFLCTCIAIYEQGMVLLTVYVMYSYMIMYSYAQGVKKYLPSETTVHSSRAPKQTRANDIVVVLYKSGSQ